MPSVVFDASSLVGALLKADSVPERALLLARSRARLCLSRAVEAELREVFARPKLARYLPPGRADRFLALIGANALWIEPDLRIAACRDAKDDKYLELAVAAAAAAIISSDADLLVLHPFRGIPILTPAAYLAG
jgi:uncharacterized protein